MFLFILESIGTSELLLIGVIALIFLGPRRMPEMARKIGKMMAEFRGTANEFKDTWRREVDFEEEVKAFDINALEDEPVARKAPDPTAPDTPSIKPVDPAKLEELKAKAVDREENEPPATKPESEADDKQNWL